MALGRGQIGDTQEKRGRMSRSDRRAAAKARAARGPDVSDPVAKMVKDNLERGRDVLRGVFDDFQQRSEDRASGLPEINAAQKPAKVLEQLGFALAEEQIDLGKFEKTLIDQEAPLKTTLTKTLVTVIAPGQARLSLADPAGMLGEHVQDLTAQQLAADLQAARPVLLNLHGAHQRLIHHVAEKRNAVAQAWRALKRVDVATVRTQELEQVKAHVVEALTQGLPRLEDMGPVKVLEPADAASDQPTPSDLSEDLNKAYDKARADYEALRKESKAEAAQLPDLGQMAHSEAKSKWWVALEEEKARSEELNQVVRTLADALNESTLAALESAGAPAVAYLKDSSPVPPDPHEVATAVAQQLPLVALPLQTVQAAFEDLDRIALQKAHIVDLARKAVDGFNSSHTSTMVRDLSDQVNEAISGGYTRDTYVNGLIYSTGQPPAFKEDPG